MHKPDEAPSKADKMEWRKAEKRSGNDIKNTIFSYKLGKVYRLVDDVRNPIRKFAKFLIFCRLLRIELREGPGNVTQVTTG